MFPEEFKTLGSATIAGLPDAGLFGTSVAYLGDLDGDGFGDIAVGSRDDGGLYNGGLRLLFLDGENNVKSFVKVPSLGRPGTVFGYSVRAIGDLDGDGVVELAVGAPYDNDGGGMYGAVYILFMNQDGTAKSSQKISALQGGFTEPLVGLSSLGSAIASLGDLDGDGNVDIAVGAYRDNGGDIKTGSVFVLFLNANGTVKETVKISGNMGGLDASLSFEGYFGTSVAAIGDLDDDGVIDLAVGSHRWDADAVDAGSVWILFLNADGTVKGHHVIDNASGDLPEPIHSAALFGTSVEYVQDINADGVEDIIVGALGDNANGSNTGALWVLLMNKNGTVANAFKVNGSSGNTGITFNSGDNFGASVAYLGLRGGSMNLAIGAIRADEGGTDRGVVWISTVIACPEFNADAGADQLHCDGRTAIILDAEAPEAGVGQWSTLYGDGHIEAPTDPRSAVNNLTPGENAFVWRVTSSQGCPSRADTVTILVESPPVAGNDTILCIGRAVRLNASKSGDQIGQWEVVQGSATFSDPHDPQAEVIVHFDSVRLNWKVESAYCPAATDEMAIRVWEIKPENFYNVITPGDAGDMNDVWVVKDLEKLPGERSLRIFNRWGTLVYSAEDYQNDWDGEGVSAGAYYYHMNFLSCGVDVKGWIHVIK